MTLAQIVAHLLATTDDPATLDGLVIEEARQVQFTKQGPVLVVRCMTGKRDSGGVEVDREGESWAEVLGKR